MLALAALAGAAGAQTGAASAPRAGASAAAAAASAAPTPVTAASAAASATAVPSMADYIVAVVNQELVTNGELQMRINRVREEAARTRTALPPADELRKQVLEVLIDERVQVTNARENGGRVDEAELERATGNIAAQNQMTLPQLRARLQSQGVTMTSFRNNLRDQIMAERVREHEVNARIHISNDEIDALLEQRRAGMGKAEQLNIAQILVTVPADASAEVVAQRRARAEAALARVRSGESFETVAREVSEDGNKTRGGMIGLRPTARLPDAFVEVVRGLKPDEVSPTLLRSAAGFHVLKLLQREEGGAMTVPETHVRHILLRVSEQLPVAAAKERVAEFKREIESGKKSFEQLARESSEDGSASAGGDLGWQAAGTFVPEFEQAMNPLPVNGISEPIVTRFGVHLIQVLGRRDTALDLKQQREQARNVLREQKFEQAYTDWVRDLRGRAYVELRDPPQ
jgi:peptidyl-prolyl cis-trans isomerase SurA